MIKPGQIIGIVGNGQLGRMSAIEAKKMGYTVYIYGPGSLSPAGQVSDLEVNGSYDDIDLISSFAQGCNVITFEFENIPADILSTVHSITPIHPDPEVLEISQNRIVEKSWFQTSGFPVTGFKLVDGPEPIRQAMEEWNSAAVLKTLTLGYDGKGQAKIPGLSDVDSAWRSLNPRQAILEQWVTFRKELSVIVSRNRFGEVAVYPVFENIHRNHILDTTIFPARISDSLAVKARHLASAVAEKMNLIGLLTIELFLTGDDTLLINEIAPRPHNSGHITFDTCPTSQFQQHIRSVCGLPPGITDPHCQGIMINILGDCWAAGEPAWADLLRIPGLNLHLYGKSDPKPGRKMGHITISGETPDFSKAEKARAILNIPQMDYR